MADVFVRVNGSIHLNHIEAKHGDIDFLTIIKNIIPKGLQVVVMNNPDRYASACSIIVSIFGEIVTHNKPQQIDKVFNTLINSLKSPVESAIFDVTIHDPVKTEQFFYAMHLSDGIVHKNKQK